MKKVLLFCMLLFCGAAYAGPMANVEYVHKVIAQQWGLEIPYNPALENPQVAANMKYLLTTVDVANKMLNGEATTDYGNSEYATPYAADTVATNKASASLIKIEPKFLVKTTEDTAEFAFEMSAKGTFMINWGDGVTEIVKRTDNTRQAYIHEYADSGKYTISIGGKATGYATVGHPAISFANNKNVGGIEGSLGAMFSTIGDGTKSGQQPFFYELFSGCTNLSSSIPETLFKGVTSVPIDSMFNSIFKNCSNLTGSIPEKLFEGIKGAPRVNLFFAAFSGCSGLTGEIPEKLFAGIQGAPAMAMFGGTFSKCRGLSGNIPEDLFAGIKGPPAANMFMGTFSGCSKLEGFSGSLFKGISGKPISHMFYSTFEGCSELAGAIPDALFGTFDGAPAVNMFSFTFNGCKKLTSIPDNLFAGISGAPAAGMFYATFHACSGITSSIPSKFFGTFDGAPAANMFLQTLQGCSGLRGEIPADLFEGIEGAPAAGMFNSTFAGCSGLTGSIPETLFNGIYGLPANNMFASTFAKCSGLDGEIPASLFERIKGAPAAGMFNSTFSDCSKLSGHIPETLFAGIDGPVASNMYKNTFQSCTQLTGSIPAGLFGKLRGAPETSMFAGAFENDKGLTGCVPYNLFDGIDATFDEIVAADKPFGNSGITQVQCAPEAKFFITTAGSSNFTFYMSAKGVFSIDWGDGNVETVTLTDTTIAPYSHTYDDTVAHTIGIGGKATEYSTADYTPAISFLYSSGTTDNIAEINGSLGAMFGTIGDGGTLSTQPRFYQTFKEALGIQGSIPENMFDGIHGELVS